MHQWALVHSKTRLTFFSSWLGQTCSVCAFSPLTYRRHLPADGPMGVAIITGFLRRKVGGGAGRGRGGSQGLFRSPPMPLHCGCCSVAQSCLTLCHPMDCSTPGLPVLHHLLVFAQTPAHRVSDTIRPSHPLLSPSPPAFNLSNISVFSNDYWKTVTLTRRIFVGKVMSLLFNVLSRLVRAFLPRSKLLLISWLQSPFAVILEPKKIKSDTVSPSISHEVMRPDAMIFVFWMLSFKPASLSSFTFIKRLFSSSLLSATRVVSSAYLRLLIFLPAILIPACASSSPAFLTMYSAYKLNKQGDNIQPWCTPFPIWNQLGRQWQPTPVLLPGKSHGRRNLVGCSPWGR